MQFNRQYIVQPMSTYVNVGYQKLKITNLQVEPADSTKQVIYGTGLQSFQARLTSFKLDKRML